MTISTSYEKMISERMMPLLNNNSAIRTMFEKGKRLAEKYGKENVYDFSLGNPSVPAPEAVNEAMEFAGRALGHRVWQTIENYMANHPKVIAAIKTETFDEEEMAMAKDLLHAALLTYIGDFLRSILWWTFLTRKSKLF